MGKGVAWIYHDGHLRTTYDQFAWKLHYHSNVHTRITIHIGNDLARMIEANTFKECQEKAQEFCETHKDGEFCGHCRRFRNDVSDEPDAGKICKNCFDQYSMDKRLDPFDSRKYEQGKGQEI